MNNNNDFQKILHPILSTFLMVIGVTFLMSFFPIYIESQGYSKGFIGVVSSSYYLGMVLGSFRIEPMICQIGHVRSFSIFLAAMVIAVIFPTLWGQSWTWFLSRFITGFSLAGLYLVLESWFLAVGSAQTRGKYLAFYMSALGLGSAISPFLMNMGDVTTTEPFSISILFLAAAIIPLTIQKSPSPEISSQSTITLKKLYKISPIGVTGCIISGFLISSIQTFIPIILNTPESTTFEISTVLGVLLLGNFVFQYPVGYISDKMDRRYILLGIGILSCLSIVIYAITYATFSTSSFLAIFCIGGSLFSMYPAAISYTCDSVDQKDIVKVTQGLLLYYGAGSVFGPLTSSLFMKLVGNVGLFLSILLFCGFYIFLLVKSVIFGKVKAPQYEYTVMPRTTPIASELDPRTDE